MATQSRTGRKLAYGISLLAVATFAVLGPRITPSVAIGFPLRIDIMVLACLGVLALLPHGIGVWRWVPQIVAGGLLGAALVSPWAAFPWLILPAMVVAWAGRGGRGRGVGRGRGPTIVLMAALMSCTLVATASSTGLRISPDAFETRDYRVNTLLSDIPLNDVWSIDLKGHPSPTLKDLTNAFRNSSPFQAAPALLGLGMLRGLLGMAFGWEDPAWAQEESSLVHRLSEAECQGSIAERGRTLGIWRVLYACPQEGVVETINGTAHVAVAVNIGEGSEGPRLFLSFRVREVNWTTPFYMRLINPSRRVFVYPFLLRQFAHTWERGGWDPTEETSTGDEK